MSYDTWGGAWGTSWGESWFFTEVVTDQSDRLLTVGEILTADTFAGLLTAETSGRITTEQTRGYTRK